MSKKELPCPHCGQDIHIPARYNADNIAALEARVAQLEAMLYGIVDNIPTRQEMDAFLEG